MGDAIKLIGIVIVIIGFALKFDTLATVVVAGIVTGLVGGMSIMDILSTLGSAFLTNRTATLFILTLPVIGLCERMGLRDKAVDFISGIKSATTGRLLSIWQLLNMEKLMKKLKMKLKEWLLEQKTMGTSLLKTVLWGHQELY